MVIRIKWPRGGIEGGRRSLTDRGAPHLVHNHDHSGEAAVTAILLVDDDALVRAGLRAIIDAQPDLRVAVRPRTAPRCCPRCPSTAQTWCSWTCACRASTASRPPACSRLGWPSRPACW